MMVARENTTSIHIGGFFFLRFVNASHFLDQNGFPVSPESFAT